MALRRVLPTPAMPNTVTARLGALTNSSALENSMTGPGTTVPALMQRRRDHKRAAISAGAADSIAGMSPHLPAGHTKNPCKSRGRAVGIKLALIMWNASDDAKRIYGV